MHCRKSKTSTFANLLCTNKVDENAITSKCVFKIKRNYEGHVNRYKNRRVKPVQLSNEEDEG